MNLEKFFLAKMFAKSSTMRNIPVKKKHICVPIQPVDFLYGSSQRVEWNSYGLNHSLSANVLAIAVNDEDYNIFFRYSSSGGESNYSTKFDFCLNPKMVKYIYMLHILNEMFQRMEGKVTTSFLKAMLYK